MAQDPQVNSRNLALELLRVRCELDRRELRAEVKSVVDHVCERVNIVGRATPWLLVVAAPILGLLVGRVSPGGRLAGVIKFLRFSLQLRQWWPWVSGFLQPRGSRSGGP